jgi:hypothetical protein
MKKWNPERWEPTQTARGAVLSGGASRVGQKYSGRPGFLTGLRQGMFSCEELVRLR